MYITQLDPLDDLGAMDLYMPITGTKNPILRA